MDKQEFWKRCDPEMREFLLDNEEVRQYLTAFDGKVTGTTAPAGIVPFQIQDRTGERYTE